MRVKSVL